MFSERVSRSLRRRVWERANGLCEYCQAPANFASASFHCEHISPRKIGGKSTLDNLAWACPWCNSAKHHKTHARDPQTGQRVPLFNPRLKGGTGTLCGLRTFYLLLDERELAEQQLRR